MLSQISKTIMIKSNISSQYTAGPILTVKWSIIGGDLFVKIGKLKQIRQNQSSPNEKKNPAHPRLPIISPNKIFAAYFQKSQI